MNLTRLIRGAGSLTVAAANAISRWIERALLIKQRLAVPTYYRPNSGDWDILASAGPLLWIVVINPHSGPSYTLSEADKVAIQNRINAVGAKMVLGYVTTNYRDIDPNDPLNTVQREFCFTVTKETGLVTTRDKDTGTPTATGWTIGRPPGPFQVRSKTHLPGGLETKTDYWWIPGDTDKTGFFARTKADAVAGNGIDHFDSDGGSGTTDHAVGLSRTLANIDNSVIFEIDEYYNRWSGIDGIFFDEMNNEDNTENHEYYKKIFDHVKTKPGKKRVVQNPGTTSPPSLKDCADIFMSFEGKPSTYESFQPKKWQLEANHYRFWHAIHSCPEAKMPDMIKRSRELNAGYVYVTDQVSPWNDIAGSNDDGTVSDYFKHEIATIEEGNAGG